MPLKNRTTLKNFFSIGNMPTQSNFADLIDSSLNIVDDGFYKSMDDGIVIAPSGKSEKLITFFDNTEYKNASWSFNLDTRKKDPALNIKNNKNQCLIYAGQNGNTGINTDAPISELHVNGFTTSDGRIGSYAIGEVPANGNWHAILPSLSGCHAFEIVAQAGKVNEGKYALLHAVAVATFGKSRTRIRKTQAYYGWFWDKIGLRWSGDTFDYSLQIKTRSHYGDKVNIRYHITKLWDDKFMNDLFAPKTEDK
ncbi:MAG: hypothetical protein QM731_19245 [Chitinophagaceae bacterium]